jgi:hypothetical protein
METECSLTNKQHHHDAAKHAATSAALALVKEYHRHKTVELAVMLSDRSLANEQLHHEAAARTATLVELALTEE